MPVGFLPIKTNPDFIVWLERQDAAVVSDIQAKWEETAAHTDITHASASGAHARLRRTMIFTAEKYGYSFK